MDFVEFVIYGIIKYSLLCRAYNINKLYTKIQKSERDIIFSLKETA